MPTRQDKKRAHWFEHIQQWKDSTMTQKKYCESKQLSYVQFLYYNRLHKQSQEVQSTNQDPVPTFIPIQSRATTTDQMQLKLPNGFMLSFPLTTSMPNLKNILEMLKTC